MIIYSLQERILKVVFEETRSLVIYVVANIIKTLCDFCRFSASRSKIDFRN